MAERPQKKEWRTGRRPPRPAHPTVTYLEIERAMKVRPYKDALLAGLGLRISARAAVEWTFLGDETRKKGRVLTFRRINRNGKAALQIVKRKPRTRGERGPTAEEWISALLAIGGEGGPSEHP
jgi:hypothetical protein